MSQYLIRKHRKWSTRLNNASAANEAFKAKRKRSPRKLDAHEVIARLKSRTVGDRP